MKVNIYLVPLPGPWKGTLRGALKLQLQYLHGKSAPADIKSRAANITWQTQTPTLMSGRTRQEDYQQDKNKTIAKYAILFYLLAYRMLNYMRHVIKVINVSIFTTWKLKPL
jgi:hypothetical protein